MALTPSKLAVVKLDNAAGALQDISGYCSACTPSWELGEYSAKPLGTTSTQYATGYFEGTVELSGYWDATIHAQMAALFAGFQGATVTSSSWEFGPGGSTAGLQKTSAELVMTSYEYPSEEDSLNTWSASFRVTGGITNGTW
jgi:hypothetical protein